MADGAKYTDIDDFGNLENIIKKFEPSYNDLSKNMPGQLANMIQKELSLAIKEEKPKEKPDEEQALSNFDLWLMAQESKNG